ncbi:DNA repair protein RadA [Haliovirga abyssi]|uniref:DNA repair protein RadA n=1 Tax=Haliovirga abyssi TaxID=2996794 RepID=A0AAU9DY95_9FUSO|nr:DNA repair protein RadA [Haliovirga abyssi]BDU50390.1 DNA repair protein RadA [Haliovirga abyssi]
MKKKEYYVCTNCGYKTNKWIGKCPECESWNSFEEETEAPIKIKTEKSIKAITINEVELLKDYRYKTNFNEFDRVLGGGLVRGEVVLLTGNPGVGKSTLLLQILKDYTKYGDVLYISGEESAEQIKHRAKRLKINSDKLFLVSETEIEAIKKYILENKPKVVGVDSIQTLYSNEYNAIPGTVTQIRESTLKIVEMAKKHGISFFIVGHITKDGKVAGPKLLEHMVDAVMSFEGEENYLYRILRNSKNRFGSINEVGIFNLEDDGISEIRNPSEFFLGERDEKNIGSIVVPVLEGTKVFLLEIQSLTSTTNFGMARRVAQGIDYNRMQILLAILEKKFSLNLTTQDIFINIPGGLSVKETTIDLAIALSILSSIRDIPVNNDVAALGELGLRGEVRKVSFITKRLNELKKMGFKKIYLPEGNRKEVEKSSINLKFYYLKNLYELLERMK